MRTIGQRIPLVLGLLLGLAATVAVSLTLHAQAAAEVEGRFSVAAETAADQIVAEVGRGVGIADAARGLMEASEQVTTLDYLTFIDALRLETRFPAVSGVSIIGATPTADTAAYVSGIDGLGQAGYAISPPQTDDDVRWPVALIEPLPANADAIGFDIRANPDARAAATEALVTGVARMTAPITLVQESGDQAGIVVYVPFDRGDGPLSEGFASVVFRGDDLLAGVTTLDPRLGAVVRDPSGPGPKGDGTVGTLRSTTDPVRQVTLERRLLGRTWEVEVQAVDGFGVSTIPAIGALVSGTLLTALLSLLVVTIQRREAQAQEIAAIATTDLAQANAELGVVNAALARTVDALERTNDELNRSNNDLSRFAHVASHDLKEPLRMVSGFAGLLRHQLTSRLGADGLDEKELSSLSYIDHGAQRMQGLITDLLDLADASNGGLRRERVDVGAELEELLDVLSTEVEASGATIELRRLDDVVMDPRQVRGLLQNLLTNALKFRRDGVAPLVTVSAVRADATWTLQVTDNGIGIPADEREIVFDAFHRRHSREQFDGTGIGLAICASIVRTHDGTVEIGDGLDGGTTFTVVLPQPPDAPAA